MTEELYNQALELVKEFKSKVWHDSDEEQPDGTRPVVAFDKDTHTGLVQVFTKVYSNHLWAYLDELL